MVQSGCFLFLFVFTQSYFASAQDAANKLYVKGGKMYIELSKQTSDYALDSFINRYEFNKLELKRFIKNNFNDSLLNQGWKLEKESPDLFIISKKLEGYEDIRKPANRILFTEKNLSFDQRFPVVSNAIPYGYNRFKNKFPFASSDSVVTFYLRNNINARKVMLAGSFNNWKPDALAMTKTDSGWVAYVKLGAGKYWYKFIVDGGWTIDTDNMTSENDGQGNTNSVYFKPNHVFRTTAFSQAKKIYVAGSFNKWRNKELLLNNNGNGWELPLYLADGTHTYRYIVDGNWSVDPENSERLPNELSDFNSVVRIGKPFHFFLEGYTDAKKAILTGSFNSWRKEELYMKKTGKGWELSYTAGPGNYQYHFIVDDKVVIQSGAAATTGNTYFIIDPNFTFRLKGFSNAKTIFLAGDFNDWSANTFAMKRAGDEWILKVHLYPGKHLYKFIVDGKWILDPVNKLWEQNEYNTGNSVLWMGKNPGM